MKNTVEMRQKRAKLIADARAILDLAESEKRELSQEEENQYEKMVEDSDKMLKEIEREERQQKIERELQEKLHVNSLPAQEKQETPESRENPRETAEYREAFNRFLADGKGALSSEEIRAMQADSAVGGGYLITPQQFVMELLKNVDSTVIIRQLATVFTLTQSTSLGVPTLDKDVDDAEWTSELKTGGKTELEFGKRELRPHPLSKRTLLSNKLIRMALTSVEQLVRDRLAYKFAVSQEKAFMTGDGSEKPLGIFTPSSNGISISRDVSSGNTATAIKCDGLIDSKYALKDVYLRNARWVFHRDAIKQIRKEKDNNGQYIWMAGITNGAPDRILEIPYIMSEFAPNTFTTGQYVGVIGDFRYYWIADALDMAIQRLVELYAESNQTGFIGRLETDGMPVLEEAFIRIKLG